MTSMEGSEFESHCVQSIFDNLLDVLSLIYENIAQACLPAAIIGFKKA